MLRHSGRPQDSYQAAQAAFSLYAHKGNVIAAERVRARGGNHDKEADDAESR